MSYIGRLCERVTLQKRARVPDGVGGYTYTWAEAQTVWAQIEQLKFKFFSFTKNAAVDKGGNKSYYRIRFRYGIKIKPSMRIKWGDRLLQVMSEPLYDPQKRWLDITAFSTGAFYE